MLTKEVVNNCYDCLTKFRQEAFTYSFYICKVFFGHRFRGLFYRLLIRQCCSSNKSSRTHTERGSLKWDLLMGGGRLPFFSADACLSVRISFLLLLSSLPWVISSKLDCLCKIRHNVLYFRSTGICRLSSNAGLRLQPNRKENSITPLLHLITES